MILARKQLMKQISILLLLLLAGQASAQTKPEAAVEAAVEALRQALVDPDRATLERLTLPELTYGHSSGLIENRSEFVEALVSGRSDFVSIDLSDQSIQVIGRKTAVVRHKLSGVLNSNGAQRPIVLSVLLIWQKASGSWKLLARQAVRAPEG